MSKYIQIRRWVPLAILMTMAMAFEPIRSGFEFANQSCELVTDWQRVLTSIFNLRHIISFGVLFLVAAWAIRENKIVIAAIGIFLFSAFLEFEQSFFVTGHCRSWDLIPNLLGIGLAVIIYVLLKVLIERKPAPVDSCSD